MTPPKSSPLPVERPVGAPESNMLFGSDTVADTLRALGVPYIALTPGASYRGLHDSIVNYLGNERPQMLLCLHEEHAVAIAQGYAKVTGKPLAVGVHANVGLLHATMAIFNAWCDRMPVIILGATGPVDATKRRPWIDWIHTTRDQGALVRNYVKWDDQPSSPAAAQESVLRAAWIAQTAPMGPVYINLDAEMQEAPLTEPLPPIDAARYMPPVAYHPAPELLARVVELLNGAKRPLILMGRGSRSLESWWSRIALAEALKAQVLSDQRVGVSFPTDHVLHVGRPGNAFSPAAKKAMAEADVILSLDWVDLAGALKVGCGTTAPKATIIQVSLDQHIHNGWSMDHQGLPAADLFLAADTDTTVAALLAAVRPGAPLPTSYTARPTKALPPAQEKTGPIMAVDVTRALRAATEGRDVSLLHLSRGWDLDLWPFRHPLDYIGGNGGGGIGAGPGVSVGAALALQGSGRLPICVNGDGDFLMGATAVWTAVHYHIPLLFVVVNNRSFFNDEVHQDRMARQRKRPVENRWIGQRMADPENDLAMIARGQGATGFGPVTDPKALLDILRQAVAAVDAGGVAVVDVRIEMPEVKPDDAPSGR